MQHKQFIFYWFVSLLATGQVYAQINQFVSSSRPADTSVKTVATLKNSHLLPLFGETTKTSAQIAFEINFLTECDQNFESRKEASEFFSARGWDYLKEGELDTACYRFNLAYLLNPGNADTYWGLGVVCYQKQQFVDAERMLRKGVNIDSSNVGLLVDLATVDLINFKQNQEEWGLIEAEQILNRAERLDSTNANMYLKKSVLEYHKGNYKAAWAYIHRTRLIDADILDYAFLTELLAKQCDPEGVFSEKH